MLFVIIGVLSEKNGYTHVSSKPCLLNIMPGFHQCKDFLADIKTIYYMNDHVAVMTRTR